MSSWRTTVLGVCALLAAVGSLGKAMFDGDPTTIPGFEEVIAAILGLGLLIARDNKVTSKQAGAK